MQHSFLKCVEPASDAAFVRYTIATLVNDQVQYDEMRASMSDGGFSIADCEFLMIDNTGERQTCAFRGLNAALDAAHGEFVILCHQDIRLIEDGRNKLDQILDELTQKDPNWALAGNAGGEAPGSLAIRISDPHGCDRSVGEFPARVMSLDENFIIVRRSARVGFSADLSGFHFYGADICLAADIMGYSSYVIDFHLLHLSAGKKDKSFARMEDAFRKKWSHALRPRWLQTTCSLLWLAGEPLVRFVGRLCEGPFSRVSKRMARPHTWNTRQEREAA